MTTKQEIRLSCFSDFTFQTCIPKFLLRRVAIIQRWAAKLAFVVVGESPKRGIAFFCMVALKNMAASTTKLHSI